MTPPKIEIQDAPDASIAIDHANEVIIEIVADDSLQVEVDGQVRLRIGKADGVGIILGNDKTKVLR